MFCKMTEQLSLYLDEDSTAPEAVKFRSTPREDEDGNEQGGYVDTAVPIPSKITICGQCSGEGKSSAYLGAFSGRRLQEAREDEEFWDDYMSGAYDRPCETCDGAGRVREPDEDRCSPEVLKAIEEQDADDAMAAAEQRHEYLVTGGWREEGWMDY